MKKKNEIQEICSQWKLNGKYIANNRENFLDGQIVPQSLANRVVKLLSFIYCQIKQ